MRVFSVSVVMLLSTSNWPIFEFVIVAVVMVAFVDVILLKVASGPFTGLLKVTGKLNTGASVAP